jgi:hypothetical protein
MFPFRASCLSSAWVPLFRWQQLTGPTMLAFASRDIGRVRRPPQLSRGSSGLRRPRLRSDPVGLSVQKTVCRRVPSACRRRHEDHEAHEDDEQRRDRKDRIVPIDSTRPAGGAGPGGRERGSEDKPGANPTGLSSDPFSLPPPLCGAASNRSAVSARPLRALRSIVITEATVHGKVDDVID